MSLETTEFIDVEHLNIKNDPDSKLGSPEDNSTVESDGTKCGGIFSFDGKTFSISCYFCEEKFIEYEIFLSHIKDKHSKLLIQDDDCFFDEYRVQERFPLPSNDCKVSEKLKNSVNDPEDAEELSENESETNKGLPHRCTMCKKAFRTELGLARHIANHRREESSEPIVNQPKKTKLPTPRHKCDYCDHLFRRPNQKIAHERIHTGERPYQCQTCQKNFRTNKNLKMHEMIHQNLKPYKCDHCPLAFCHSSNRKMHIRRAHLIDKQHKCDFCEKSFVSKGDCRRHMRCHTGEKPYQCEECGLKFRISGILTVHRRLHHSDERRYECKTCGRKFKMLNNLNEHLASHSTAKPFKCETCGAAFSRRNAYNSHKKIHSDVKEYVCKLCGKEYSQHAGLYSHMKSHKIDKRVKTSGSRGNTN